MSASQDERQDSVKAPLKSFKQRRNFGKKMFCRCGWCNLRNFSWNPAPFINTINCPNIEVSVY